MIVVLIPHPRRRYPYAKFERLASRAHTEELEAAPAIYIYDDDDQHKILS